MTVNEELQNLREFMRECPFLTTEDRRTIRGVIQRYPLDASVSPRHQAADHIELQVDLALLSARLKQLRDLQGIEVDRHLNEVTARLMDEAELDRDRVVDIDNDGKRKKPPAAATQQRRIKVEAEMDKGYIKRLQKLTDYERLFGSVDKLQWSLKDRGALLDGLIRKEF